MNENLEFFITCIFVIVITYVATRVVMTNIIPVQPTNDLDKTLFEMMELMCLTFSNRTRKN